MVTTLTFGEKAKARGSTVAIRNANTTEVVNDTARGTADR